jgi:MFS family permease
LAPPALAGITALARRLPWLLIVVLTGQFMAILDVTIVNVATPTIRLDLHASGGALQLIVAAYTIAYAVLLITGARLGALVGYRRMFLIGLAVFTSASLACGLAPTSEVVIVFRTVQGGGAAMMVPQVFSLIQRGFQGAARARALSIYAAVIALAALVGQVLGGLIVSADVLGTGWRPVFLVNVPIGIVLIVAALRTLPIDRRETALALDVPGLVTLAAAVLLLVVPLVLGHEAGWPAWTGVSLAASVVMFVVFVAIERSVARRGGMPLISGSVLRAPGMLPATVALFLGMAGYGGFLFSFAQDLQAGLGKSPLDAGLTFAPAAIGFAVGGLTWRRLRAAWHGPIIPIGFAVALVGYLGVALALRDGGPGGPALPVVLALAGIGMGYAFSPALSVALSTVAPADASDASGLLTTVIQLGQVVGVATFGSAFLTLAIQPGVHPMAAAISSTLASVAVAMACCAVAALPLARRRVSAEDRGHAVAVRVIATD